MAITSYSTLKTAIADWLDRDDLSDQLDTFIDLCEAWVYRDLRIEAMESSLSVAMSGGVAAVPSDFLELRYAYLNTTPIVLLDITDPNTIYARYPTRSATGMPKMIARDDTGFFFGPYPDSDYSLGGTYYARLTALSSSNETNWFTTNAPDLLLFGSLVAATPYLGDDSRAVIWKAQYDEAMRAIRDQDRRERHPTGSPMMAVAR